MGLKSDLDEVTQHWSRAPWRVKIFLAIALFLSTSSLASLSEAVFRWKGFVLDALGFYRQWVAEPIVALLQRVVERNVPNSFVDNAVLLGLFMAAVARVLLFRRASRTKHAADIVVCIAVYAVMLYLFAGEANPKPGGNTVWILYPLYVFMAYVSTNGAERILALAYVLAPALLVGLLAAISSGLAK